RVRDPYVIDMQQTAHHRSEMTFGTQTRSLLSQRWREGVMSDRRTVPGRPSANCVPSTVVTPLTITCDTPAGCENGPTSSWWKVDSSVNGTRRYCIRIETDEVSACSFD